MADYFKKRMEEVFPSEETAGNNQYFEKKIGTLDRFYEKYGNVSSGVSTPGVQRPQSSPQKQEKEKGTLDKFYEKYGALHRQSFQDDFDSRWNQYQAGYQHTMQTIQEDLANADYGNIGDLNKRYSENANGLIEQYSRLKTLLEGGRDNFTEEDYRRYSDFLEQSQADLGEQLGRLGDYTRYFGQSGNEEEYELAKKGITGQEKQPAIQIDQGDNRNLDISSYEQEIQALEQELKNYSPDFDWTDASQRKQYEDEVKRREAEISQKKTYLNQARMVQKRDRLSSVADSESEYYDRDFADKSQYVSTKSENLFDRVTSQFGMGYNDLQYEYINNQDGIRDEIRSKSRAFGSSKSGESIFEEKGYDYLTENEVALYDYYYAKGGKEAAQEYLDTIQDDLNQRKAGEYFQGMEGNTPLELAFGVAAGVDQFRSGLKSFVNTGDDYIPATATQYASGAVREDLADVGPKLPDGLGGASLGQVGYDTVTTTANMAPSILTSMAVGILNPAAGKAVGDVLVGASAAGNAYQEMLNSGYDKKQARAYSSLIGASEAGLQYLLGGISKLGGKLSGSAVEKMVEGIDNAFVRAAVELGGNMFSEGLEEGLQEILTPWFKNMALHVDEDVDWSEVAYSSLLGALTSGLMEGPQTVSDAVSYSRAKNATAQVSADGGGAAGISDSAAAGKGYSVSRNESRGTTEIRFEEKPSTDMQNVLKENGFKWSKKNKVWYGTKTAEQAESMVQRAMGADPAASVTDSQRAEPGISEKDSAGEADGRPKEAVSEAAPDDAPFDVSWVAGKTLLNRDDGSTVETRITGIASNEKGKLMLNVAGQSEPVSAGKVSYADSDDAALYHAINSMDITPGAANEFVELANKMGDKKGEFVYEIKNMYTLGEMGVPLAKAVKSGYADNLTGAMQEFGYALGRRVYDEKVQKAEAGKKSVAAAQKKNASSDGVRVNGVLYDGVSAKRSGDGSVEIEGISLNEQQRAGIRAAEMLSQIGANIHVFMSQTDANGNPIGDNGSYSTRDGSIHIDLNAGNAGQGVMAYTLSHEFTHFMEQQSPAMFQKFTDSLFTELDADIEAEIVSKVEQLKKQRPEQYKDASEEVLRQDARSEVVAEACETMLTDTDAAQRIAQRIQKQDATLWEKVAQWFRDLGDKLRKAYQGLSPDSDIAREAKKTIQQVDGLVKMWADMAVDAAENYRTADTEAGIADVGGGVKAQARENDSSRKYSYDALVSKPDMNVTVIDGEAPKSRADVVYYAKQNARKIGKFNVKDGSVSIRVKDIGRDVVLSTAGLKHSLDRRFDVNAPVTMMAGSILQNSILMNEMTAQHPNAENSYVLVGAAQNTDGQLYIVRSVVNRFSNEVTSMDVLYAFNAKTEPDLRIKKETGRETIPNGPQHDAATITGSTISISNLLDYVNEYFPDILPEDVLRHYGHEARPAGKLGESALYSERGGNTGNHQEELAKARAKMTQDAQNEKESVIRDYQEKRGVSLQNWRRTEVDVLRQAAENTAELNLSEKEKTSLGLFQKKLGELDSLQEKYEEIRNKDGILSEYDLDMLSRYQKKNGGHS